MAKKWVAGVLAVALVIGMAFGIGLATIGAASAPVAADCCGGGPWSSHCPNGICEPQYGENSSSCWQDCPI